MPTTNDCVSHGAKVKRLGSQFRWPGGRHVAVVFNVAYEAWSAGKASGVGPMGNPLPGGVFDTNALSWGSYGTDRGIERLLRNLDRAKTKASIMVNGILAELAPRTLRSIAEAGHEIVAHSWAQEIVPATLDLEREKSNVAKTTDALRSAAGVKPKGWMSPRCTPSPNTARLLVEAGYEWNGDIFDDDRPYLQSFDQGSLVAVPFTMEINDLPHAMRFGRSPRQFVEMFEDTLTHAVKSEDRAVMIDVTAHTHVFGRPSGAWAYEEILKKAAGSDDIWIATRGEIADVARSSLIPGRS